MAEDRGQSRAAGQGREKAGQGQGRGASAVSGLRLASGLGFRV